MKVVALRETEPGERRVALVPDTARALAKLGLSLAVEAGAGAGAGVTDEAYEKAGVRVERDRAALLADADLVLKVQPPSDAEIASMMLGERGDTTETENGVSARAIVAEGVRASLARRTGGDYAEVTDAEILDGIEAVGASDVLRVAAHVFDGRLGASVLGDLRGWRPRPEVSDDALPERAVEHVGRCAQHVGGADRLDAVE